MRGAGMKLGGIVVVQDRSDQMGGVVCGSGEG